MTPGTRVIDGALVDALLCDPEPGLDALREGFVVSATDTTVLRVRAALPGAGTATALLPGLLPGVPAYTVKVNAKFPGATPALRGVVCLHALGDGELLALIDSASLTAWRTGLAAALITDRLAPPGERTLGIVGAGAQARMVLRGLTRLRRIAALVVHDADDAAGRSFVSEAAATYGLHGTLAGSAAEVAREAEVVVLATWSRRALLSTTDLARVRHVTSLGADERGKRELGRDVLESATLVVDDRRLAAESGVLATERLPAAAVAADAGQLLRGEHPGRVGVHQLTAYVPVGMPWQDLALAWPLLRAAERQRAGITVDLLGAAPGA